ncbi:RNA polymerase sigma factor, partial [Butyricimonas virosa]
SLEGYSVQEIALQLEISINTVKTQKKRAYSFLKENLKQYFSLLLLLGILK